jgi:hypothetical protein
MNLKFLHFVNNSGLQVNQEAWRCVCVSFGTNASGVR